MEESTWHCYGIGKDFSSVNYLINSKYWEMIEEFSARMMKIHPLLVESFITFHVNICDKDLCLHES